MPDPIDENWLTTAKSEQRLNPRELEVYREHRRNVLTWMLNKGQNPNVNIGYAEETVENRGYRLDMFYRWVWDVKDGYTDDITTSQANSFMKYLHPQSYSQVYKAAFQKAIQTLFRWQEDERGKSVDWEPSIRFQSSLMPSSKEALSRQDFTVEENDQSQVRMSTGSGQVTSRMLQRSSK